MSLKFKFIPLTFIKDEEEIKKQIRNTIILKYFFEKNSKTVKLNSLIENTQYGYNASALQSGKNKFLRISDITDGKVEWDTVPYCDCNDEETYLLYSDDILIARTGGTTGKSFFIIDPPKHAIYAGYLIRIRANEKNNPLFINLFLNSYVYWSQIVSINEGEFRPSANANVLKNLILPQCTPNEQEDAVNLSNSIIIKGYEDLNNEIKKALVDFEKIKKIEKGTDFQTKQVALLQQAILQDAIQGKLTADWREQNSDVESASELLKRIKSEKAKLIKEKKIKKEKPLSPINDNEIPFELPDKWEWCRIGMLAEIVRGGSPRPAGDRRYYDGNIPFLKVGDLTNDNEVYVQNYKYTVKEAGLHKTRYIEKETLLLTNSGATLGIPKIVNFPTAFNDGIAAFNEMHIDLSKKYVYYFLRYKTTWFLKEASKGIGQPNLNTDIIKITPLSLPPIKEQQAIVEKVELLLEKSNQLAFEIENQKRYSLELQKALFNEIFELKEKESQEITPQRETEVNTQTISLKPTNIDYYKRSVLAAEIVWQLHKEPTLGHLKLQKLIYLCQKTTNMQLVTNFLRQAMGPYDNQLMRSIDKQLKDHKWFEYNSAEKLKYQPLEKAGEHHADYLKYFSSESTNIQYIIDTFKQAKSNVVEIVATLYACMENILNEKNIIYSEGLLLRRFYEWSEEKQKFSEEVVQSVLKRMKEIGIVPDGLKN